MDQSDTKTSFSLLLRVKQGDQDEDAWRAFVERYGSRIYQWCLNRRLQPSDAEDVTQVVLFRLARRMKAFEYDPNQSFRGWLRRITENALNDFFSERPGWVLRDGEAMDHRLVQAEARVDLEQRLEEAFDLELLDVAVARIRNRVSENRFQAWELATRQGLNGTEIAKRLNMKVATVYTARNQIQDLLKYEIRKLEQSSIKQHE